MTTISLPENITIMWKHMKNTVDGMTGIVS